MRGGAATALALLATTILAGCGTYPRQGLDAAQAQQLEQTLARHESGLTPEQETKILALDPRNVTGQDVRELLSNAPAPRIINLHGGVHSTVRHSRSFAEFLIGMGYPGRSLTNASDGTWTFSCYESSRKIAGVIAWYYEKEGLRPMMVGHSQGGMQAVKVLHRLAQKPPAKLHVWNPITWSQETRCEIIDPIDGYPRPVAGLILPYASAVGSGGLARLLPNQWDMCLVPGLRLHRIPDAVEEFTGFCKGADLWGGDYLGYGPMNHYKPEGHAAVRNVWLPSAYKHMSIPDTKHLLNSQPIRAWIDHYRPADEWIVKLRLDEQFDADASNILWAADVWYSIKKHWVLELQRWIRARRAQRHEF